MDKLGRFGDNYFWGLHARVRRCPVRLASFAQDHDWTCYLCEIISRTIERENERTRFLLSFVHFIRGIALLTFVDRVYFIFEQFSDIDIVFAYVLRLKMKICIILLLNYFETVLIEDLPNDSNESIRMIHGINTFFFFFFLWIRKGNDKIIQYNN